MLEAFEPLISLWPYLAPLVATLAIPTVVIPSE
jgi:hypothetical protein